MLALEFFFTEVLEEIHSISRIASSFIAPFSVNVLPQLKSQLESIRAARPRTGSVWGIREDYPLRTIESNGRYKAGGGGGQTVYGELTSKWEVVCPQEGGAKSKAQNCFALVGTASTRVRVFHVHAESDPTEVATWRMEVGDVASPGCHFHVQVLGENHHTVFPHFLEIPRFQGIIVTPMAAIEFVLGELFQDEWKEHAAHETSDMNIWRPIQQRRLKSLAEWQLKCVGDCAGSPWTAFKTKKPGPKLFVYK